MKAYIETFGCQMNEYDSQRIAYYLEEMGYEKTDSARDSDIIIINTCSVREKAENRLFGHLGSLKSLKEIKDILICVGGCTAQSLAAELQRRAPFVDIVFGTHNISSLPGLIKNRLRTGKKICTIEDDGFDLIPDRVKRTDRFRAIMPVSIGCNNYCSYCIVPYVRGKERSIAPGTILENLRDLAAGGVKQVTLLGQNVNSYGGDLDDGPDFPGLLQMVSEIEGLERIRFMTSHPKDLSLPLIETISSRDNIMNHIHLPLQAGSNRVLEMMNRKYTRERYLDIIETIRSYLDECSITTDIIVGFPGEHEKDFKDTLDVVRKARFDGAFTFIYSPRRGTSAASLDDPVQPEEKKRWFSELLKLQNKISRENKQQLIGKKFKALIECISPGKPELLQGRLENNTIVHVRGEKNMIGRIVEVYLTEAKTFYVIGTIINDKKTPVRSE